MKQPHFESSPVRQHGNARANFIRVLLMLCLLVGTASYYSPGDSDWAAEAVRYVRQLFDSTGVGGSSEASVPDQDYDLWGTVTHVKDGDSLILNAGGREVEVRLHGVDAPEWKQPHGEAAKRSLKKMVLKQQVGVKAVTIDSFGRTVGTLFFKASNINVEMVRTGNAWWYRRYAGDDRALRQAERQAQQQRVGLWRGDNPIPPWNWRRSH